MKNTGILYVRMLVTLLVSLYTSRVTLELLGIDDFGVYGVIGGVVGLFAFLTRTLTTSFNRYLCRGIAKNNQIRINGIVSASLIIQFLIISIVLLIGEPVGLWFINNYLVVSPEKISAAHIVFQLSVLTFIVNIFTSAYNSIIISYERMSVYAYICIIEVVAKLMIVFALALSSSHRLELYSLYLFIVQCFVLVFYIWYVKNKYSEIAIKFNGCKKYVYSMISFAGYGFIGSFAFVVKNQGLNFLLNIFGGPALNAARTISFQVYTAIYNFVGNFQTAFSPYILKQQSINSQEACNRDVRIFTQMSFGIMVILMIPIWYAAKEIIHFWLGNNVPEYTIFFTRIILIIGLCEAVSAPLLNIIHGSGRIKTLQISALFIYLSTIAVSYILLHLGFQAYTVYYFDLCANICMFIIRIVIAKFVTDLKLRVYLHMTMLPIIIIISIISFVYILIYEGIMGVIPGILLSESIICVYIYLYTPTELRAIILDRIKQLIK